MTKVTIAEPEDYHYSYESENPNTPNIASNWRAAQRIERVAKEQGIPTGVVVGRLQFARHIPFANLNALKVKYT